MAHLNRLFLNKKVAWKLNNENNPLLNSNLPLLPELNGKNIVTQLNEVPYMEACIGISNIFNILRVDLVKRINYLDDGRFDRYQIFGVRGLELKFKGVFRF